MRPTPPGATYYTPESTEAREGWIAFQTENDAFRAASEYCGSFGSGTGTDFTITEEGGLFYAACGPAVGVTFPGLYDTLQQIEDLIDFPAGWSILPPPG